MDLAQRQYNQRIYGEWLVPQLIDKFGVRNLEIISQGQTIDIGALMQSLNLIKDLIVTGALSTARGYTAYYRPQFPLHDDLFEWTKVKITEFLVGGGYEEPLAGP